MAHLYSYPLSVYNVPNNSNLSYVNILYQNFNILGNNYDSIVVVHNQSPVDNTINDSFYYSTSLCFVKYVIQHPQDSVFKTMELQRYHIVL